MKSTVWSLALAAVLCGAALPAVAQSAAPPLPALSAEQMSNLDQELLRYRRDVDDRVARGELREDEAQRLIEWRRWQLARQIAGLTPPEPTRVIVQREYVPQPYYAPQPYAWGYDPYYGRPYYGGPVYYGPRVSVCAGGFGRHSFGSLCF